MDKKKPIQINFNNGTSSTIDENVYALILDLEKKIKNPMSLPPFWNLSSILRKNFDDDFLKFYNYLLTYYKESKSQLFQDLFVIYKLSEKTNGTFLEFGATNGLDMSNTYLLENKFKWNGVLAEPSYLWHSSLKKNRPNCKILNECIYSESGKKLDFFTSSIGELSTLEQFRESDLNSINKNTTDRNKKGFSHKVMSISLNDVFMKYFNSSPIDYMSVDTEGSELLILENFDFEKFSPKIVTVEHNFTESQNALDTLFSHNNYKRIFKEHTQFDAWYVLQN